MQCRPQQKVETRGGAKVEDKTRAKLNAALPGQVALTMLFELLRWEGRWEHKSYGHLVDRVENCLD